MAGFLNIRPVIQRELTVASRRRETWRMRLVFGGGAVAAFAFGMLLPDISVRNRGQVVLISLSVCGFVLSLFTGAYLTADAITSEKREGTLGLLFLTPLNGWQIVLGKMLTHSLQVGYAVLGGFPLLFIPILLGGVVWSEVTRILLVLVLTLLLSLACGMFWSTVAREARTAVLATVVSVILITLLPWLPGLLEVMMTRRSIYMAAPALLSPMTQLIGAFEENYRTRAGQAIGQFSGAFLYWGSVLSCATCSVVLMVVSGRLLPKVWRRSEAGEPIPSSVSRGKIRLASRRTLPPQWAPTLRADPLLWLAARDLREPLWPKLLRWATWLFFAWMLLFAVTTRGWVEGFISAICAAYGLHLLTRIQFLLAATRRLNEDRRNGALELLLVTPVRDAEIVRAHHESLKRAFRRPLLALLAMNGALLLSVIVFARHLHMDGGDRVIFCVFFLGGAVVTLADFPAMRWLALREALRTTNQLKAAGRAFARLVGVPWAASGLAFLIAIQSRDKEIVGLLFGLWALYCVFYDQLMIWRCRRWLRAGLRKCAAEG